MMQKIKGFTLVELMLVLGILALLLSLAYPSYISFVRKARRAEAQETMLDWANQLEIFRADQVTYDPDAVVDADLLRERPPPPDDTTYYSFDSDLSANAFTLTATALGNQDIDKQGEQSCSTLVMNESGDRGDGDNATGSVCWRQN